MRILTLILFLICTKLNAQVPVINNGDAVTNTGTTTYTYSDSIQTSGRIVLISLDRVDVIRGKEIQVLQPFSIKYYYYDFNNKLINPVDVIYFRPD